MSSSPPSTSNSDGMKVALVKRILAVCLKAQWLVGGSCALVAILYPQVEVYGFLLGAFCNAFLSKGLKRLIAQDRPTGAGTSSKSRKAAAVASNGSASSSSSSSSSDGPLPAAAHIVSAATSGVVASAVDAAIFAADSLGVDHPSPTAVFKALPVEQHELGHGMPSSHAMSLSYFAVYIALATATVRLGEMDGKIPKGEVKSHPFIVLLRRVLPEWMEDSWDQGFGHIVFVVVLYTILTIECITRVKRRFHTWQQIVVGGILGSIVGFLHHTYVMPWIREMSADVPPLSERSAVFVGTFTLFMTLLSALTLERHTQRFAKKLITRLMARIRGNKSK